MKKPTNGLQNSIAAKAGGYSAMVTALVLAIVIVGNILLSALPKTWTKLDISSTRLYSVTSSTKAVLAGLEKDVDIYWIAQPEAEDSVIENLLEKYEGLSSHVTVTKKNPDVSPTFASQYTDEEVGNNGLIVAAGERSRYISYDEIYRTDVDYTNYNLSYSFDGEGVLTSAIAYVVSEEEPVIYLLEGHGEGELSDSFAQQLEKENVETRQLSLTQNGEVPEDADGVMIYAPESDLSSEEKNLLAEYVYRGGKLLVIAGTGKEGTLENLCALAEDYGAEVAEGMVIEEDSDHYAFNQQLILMPELGEDTLTAPLAEEGYHVILPLAQGFKLGESDFGEVTVLLESSADAFSKREGYAMTSYERSEEDEAGPLALGFRATSTYGGELVWIGSSYFLEDLYNAYSSGANLDLAMNAVSAMMGETETIAIRSKSLGYSYLTISEANASFLKTWMIALVPGAFALYGVVMAVDRRRKRK